MGSIWATILATGNIELLRSGRFGQGDLALPREVHDLARFPAWIRKNVSIREKLAARYVGVRKKVGRNFCLLYTLKIEAPH